MGERDAVKKCQMIGAFLSCHGDGKAVPFTWRGARLCRTCMRIAMVSGESWSAALTSAMNMAATVSLDDYLQERLGQWKAPWMEDA